MGVLSFSKRLLRKPGGAAGTLFLSLLVLAALLAPYIAPYDPNVPNPASALAPPSRAHLMGTDRFGRDMFSRVIYGGRISLQVGIIAVSIGAFVGVSIGLIAGYWGGLLDNVLMRMMDVMLAFPGILLALLMIVVLGPGLVNIMIAVGIAAIPSFARLARGSTLSVKESAYVEAARSVGASSLPIIVRHILPNIAAPLIIFATLRVGTAMLSAASLSFLGLGAEPPTPEWGLMAAIGRHVLRRAWWVSIFPGLAIALTVVSLNLLGDALRDILDPRFRGLEATRQRSV